MEAPRGSFTDPLGRRRSARIEERLRTAVSTRNQTDAEKISLEDGILAAVEQMPTSGGRRKLKGGSETEDAIRELKEKLVTASEEAKTSFDQKIAGALRSIPGLIGAYGGKTLAGISTAVLVKYPTIFANIVALATRLIPIPSGGDWSAYGNAASIIVGAFADLGIDITSKAVSGPLIAVLVGLYVQRQRAAKNETTLAGQFLADAVAVKDKTTTAIQGQVEAFKTAYRGQTQKNALEDLRKIADLMAQERTMPTTSMTSTGVGDITEKVTGMPEPGLASRKRKPGVPVEELEKERPGAPKKAKTEEDESASSSSSTASSSMGGRRRKTRKPKKVRRVTRRRRAIVY